MEKQDRDHNRGVNIKGRYSVSPPLEQLLSLAMDEVNRDREVSSEGLEEFN